MKATYQYIPNQRFLVMLKLNGIEYPGRRFRYRKTAAAEAIQHNHFLGRRGRVVDTKKRRKRKGAAA